VIFRQARDTPLGGQLDGDQARQAERRPDHRRVHQVVPQPGRRIGEVELLGLDARVGFPLGEGARP
jgi:hypothetical protein